MAKRPTTIKALCKRHNFTIDEWLRPEDTLSGYGAYYIDTHIHAITDGGEGIVIYYSPRIECDIWYKGRDWSFTGESIAELVGKLDEFFTRLKQGEI